MKRTAPATAALLACCVLAPAATSSAAGTPAPQQVTGTVQTVIREQPPSLHHGGGDRTSTVLRVGTRVVPLTEGSLPDAESGDRVTAALVPAAEGTSHVLAARTLAAAPKPAVSTTQAVYLALVLPTGFTKAASATTAAQMVAKASAYWSSQTGGQVKFAVKQALAYKSGFSCGKYGEHTDEMRNEAARKMPAALGPDKHLVVVAPPGAYNSGCDYGLGTIGEGVHTTDSAVFVSDLNPSLFAHELGHNLGLYHSNSFRCRTTQDWTYLGGWPVTCHQEEYDDLFDVMGYSGTGYGEGSLNGVQLDALHLLPTALRRITTAGTVKVRLAPLSTTTAGRAVRVTDPTGVSYVLQYRTRSGRDAAAAGLPDKPSYGVEVLRADPTVPGGGGSDVLDATPSTATYDYARTVPVGTLFTAASRRLVVHVTSADAGGASVTIYNGRTLPAAVPSRLTISMPTKASYGGALTAATKVTDQFGRPRSGWSVTLQKLQRGTTTWKPVRTLTTSRTGTASYRLTNGLSGAYRWAAAAPRGGSTRYSTSVAVSTTTSLTIGSVTTSVLLGRSVGLSGRVNHASVPAAVAYLQYRRAGTTAWMTGARATVRSTAISGWLRLPRKGTYDARLYLKSGTAYVGAVSPSRRTVVR